MSRIAVAAIVEGHGEQQSAVRTLVSRIWVELLGGEFAHVLRPIRRPRYQVVRPDELLKAIDLADLQLKTVVGYETKLILVLLDADTDLPCELGPRLLAVAQSQRSHLNVSIVIANVEFETWFVGAASSLSAYFDLEAVNLSADPREPAKARRQS